MYDTDSSKFSIRQCENYEVEDERVWSHEAGIFALMIFWFDRGAETEMENWGGKLKVAIILTALHIGNQEKVRILAGTLLSVGSAYHLMITHYIWPFFVCIHLWRSMEQKLLFVSPCNQWYNGKPCRSKRYRPFCPRIDMYLYVHA